MLTPPLALSRHPLPLFCRLSLVRQVRGAYDASKGDKVIIFKAFDEKKAVLDVEASTTAVRWSSRKSQKYRQLFLSSVSSRLLALFSCLNVSGNREQTRMVVLLFTTLGTCFSAPFGPH